MSKFKKSITHEKTRKEMTASKTPKHGVKKRLNVSYKIPERFLFKEVKRVDFNNEQPYTLIGDDGEDITIEDFEKRNVGTAITIAVLNKIPDGAWNKAFKRELESEDEADEYVRWYIGDIRWYDKKTNMRVIDFDPRERTVTLGFFGTKNPSKTDIKFMKEHVNYHLRMKLDDTYREKVRKELEEERKYKEFQKVLLKYYDKLKNPQGFANLQDLTDKVSADLRIWEHDFEKLRQKTKSDGIFTYSIMPGREIRKIKIMKEE